MQDIELSTMFCSEELRAETTRAPITLDACGCYIARGNIIVTSHVRTVVDDSKLVATDKISSYARSACFTGACCWCYTNAKQGFPPHSDDVVPKSDHASAGSQRAASYHWPSFAAICDSSNTWCWNNTKLANLCHSNACITCYTKIVQSLSILKGTVTDWQNQSMLWRCERDDAQDVIGAGKVVSWYASGLLRILLYATQINAMNVRNSLYDSRQSSDW